jgi:hypothetical protein
VKTEKIGIVERMRDDSSYTMDRHMFDQLI